MDREKTSTTQSAAGTGRATGAGPYERAARNGSPANGAAPAQAAEVVAGPAPLHAVSPAESVARVPGRAIGPSDREAELPHAPEDLPTTRPRGRWLARLAPVAPYAAISAGAVLGANARYVVGGWAAAQWGSAFPWGTFVINVTGSLLLGFYLTLVTERFAGRATTRLFVATGFCGAYTTFSTFSYEAVTLLQRGAVGAAVAYVLGSLVVGLLAVGVGILAARAL